MGSEIAGRAVRKAVDFHPKLFHSLRHYTVSRLKADIIAGIVVGIVALPLAIAFGIASGVSPTIGLVTAIIGGFMVSFFGGNSVQIGGPTGAFIIIVYNIIGQFGLHGLAVATFMAGVILVLLGLFRLGTVIKFIPYPIVVGFTLQFSQPRSTTSLVWACATSPDSSSLNGVSICVRWQISTYAPSLQPWCRCL